MAAGADLSVIIPTLNEAPRLDGQLASLMGQPGIEVIVADGGSEDGTPELARRLGAVTVSAGRGRGRQMNAGAACAGGSALLFLHADTRLPAGFKETVLRVLAGGAVGGAFSFSLDDDRPFLRFITRTTNFRARTLGIIFGDQAIFARSDAFRAAGGYPDQPLLEDFELVRRLRQLGRVAVAEDAVVTSARRWTEVGPVRNSAANLLITWAYVLGVDPGRLREWRRRLCRPEEGGPSPRPGKVRRLP